MPNGIFWLGTMKHRAIHINKTDLHLPEINSSIKSVLTTMRYSPHANFAAASKRLTLKYLCVFSI
jgi:hypothetical protein